MTFPQTLTNKTGDTRTAQNIADKVRFEFDGFKAAPAVAEKPAKAKAASAA